MSVVSAAAVAAHGNSRALKSRRDKGLEEKGIFRRNMKLEAHFIKLRQLLEMYDKDKSGTLNAEELAELIEHYRDGAKVTGPAPPPPTREEIECIIRTAGKHKRDSVDICEIELALDLWHSYVTNRETIEATFAKYDSNHSRCLDFGQLKHYLTDLSKEHPPSDAEVKMILDEVHADENGIFRIQLTLATSLWFIHLEQLSKNSCCAIC